VQSQSRWHSNLEWTVHPMLTKCRIRARDNCTVDKFLSSDWYRNTYFPYSSRTRSLWEITVLPITTNLKQRSVEFKVRNQGIFCMYVTVLWAEAHDIVLLRREAATWFFLLTFFPRKNAYLCLLWRGTRLGPTVRYVVQIQRAGRCVTCTVPRFIAFFPLIDLAWSFARGYYCAVMVTCLSV
jgi:hypothetical protein